MVDDALEVPSVASERLVPVCFFLSVEGIVIVRIGIGEPVRAYQVDEVGRGETLPARGAFLPSQDGIRPPEGLPVIREYKIVSPWFHVPSDRNVDEKIVRTLGFMHLRDLKSGSLD